MQTAETSYIQAKIPQELIQQIFAFLDPTTVLQYTRLCRHIQKSLQEPYFAVSNLRKHVRVALCLRRESFSPDIYDRVWTSWPPAYQSTYAKLVLKELVSISWFGKIAGRLTDALGELVHLQYLNLNGGKLGGEIPSSIGLLLQLKELSLSGNRICGYIPKEIGYLIKLQHLDLSNNMITGRFPDEICELTELISLCLARNQIEGLIPDAIGDMSNLREISLAHNTLSGNVPLSLSRLSQLEEFDVRGNSFETIPSFLLTLNWLKKWNI